MACGAGKKACFPDLFSIFVFFVIFVVERAVLARLGSHFHELSAFQAPNGLRARVGEHSGARESAISVK